MNQCSHLHFSGNESFTSTPISDTERSTASPKCSEAGLSKEAAVVFQEADPSGCLEAWLVFSEEEDLIMTAWLLFSAP